MSSEHLITFKWAITSPNSNDTLSYKELCHIARGIFRARPQYVVIRADGLNPYKLNNLIAYFMSNDILVSVETDGSAILEIEDHLIHQLYTYEFLLNSMAETENLIYLFENLEFGLDPYKVYIKTYFDRSNISEFSTIRSFANGHCKSWTPKIAFNKKKLPSADDIKALRFPSFSGNQVVDVQLKECKCNAGLTTFGVLHNGDVVACVDEEIFNPKMEVFGNLLKSPFTRIRENAHSIKKDCKQCIWGKKLLSEVFDDTERNRVRGFVSEAQEMRREGDINGLLNMINRDFGQFMGVDIANITGNAGTASVGYTEPATVRNIENARIHRRDADAGNLTREQLADAMREIPQLEPGNMRANANGDMFVGTSDGDRQIRGLTHDAPVFQHEVQNTPAEYFDEPPF